MVFSSIVVEPEEDELLADRELLRPRDDRPARRAQGEAVEEDRRREGGGLVDLGIRHDLLDRLEDLRLLVLAGDAHHLEALADARLGAGIEGEAQHRLRREAGPQAVADQARQAQQRIALARGAQEELVGDPLVVEREDVARRGEEFEDGDGVVVALARRQAGERRLLRDRFEHRLAEGGEGADAIGDLAKVPAGCRSASGVAGDGRLAACAEGIGAMLQPSDRGQAQNAVLGKIPIVVEARDLERRSWRSRRFSSSPRGGSQ